MNKSFLYIFLFVFAFSFTSAVAVSDGLVAHYKSNTQNFTASNQTTILDSTGVNTGTFVGKTFNNGVASGGVTIEDGAMKFDGLDSALNCSTSFNSGVLNQLTLSLWIKPNIQNSGNDVTVIQNAKNNTLTNNRGFWLTILNSTKSYRIGFGNGTNREYESGYSIDYNNFQHLLVTFNNGNVSFYKNGILNVTSTWSLGSSINLSEIERLYISDKTNEFNGSINNVQIYNRSLSSSEIAGLYALGKDEYTNVSDGLVAQYSGRDYAGTPSAPTTIYDTNQLVKGKVNQGFGFDGINNSIRVSSITRTLFNQSGTYTVSNWFKLNSLPNGYRSIWNFQDGSNNRIALMYGTNYIGFSRFNGSTYTGKTYFNGNFNLNTWYHVTAISNNGNIFLYLDSNETSNSSTNYAGGSSNNYFSLGFMTTVNSAYAINGSIDDVRIYNRSLSASEISALYNAGLGIENEMYVANSTYVTILNNASTTNWPENSQLTFTSQEDIGNTLNWSIDGVQKLLGTTRAFTYTFANPVTAPMSVMTMATSSVFKLFNINTNSDNPTIVASLVSPVIFNMGDTQVLNYQITDPTITTCWYVYGNVNTSLDCGGSSTSFVTTLGNTSVVVYAQDNVGNVASLSLNFEFDLPTQVGRATIIIAKVINAFFLLALVMSFIFITIYIFTQRTEGWGAASLVYLMFYFIIGLVCIGVLSNFFHSWLLRVLP